ncbi:MAG: hypothetical protein R6V75_09300 [Bacteroidales bacterium]
MIIRFSFILVLFSLQLTDARAQRFEIQARAYPSSWYNGWFEPAIDGGGLLVGYHPRLSNKLEMNINGEFSILRARSELILGLGFRHTIWQSGRLSLTGEANLLNGLGLFRPTPLWVGGGELLARGGIRIGKRATLFLSAGARYTACPGYRAHGPWRQNAWPIGIGIGW